MLPLPFVLKSFPPPFYVKLNSVSFFGPDSAVMTVPDVQARKFNCWGNANSRLRAM